MSSINIYIGADYRAYDKKMQLLPYLEKAHPDYIKIIDKGADTSKENDYNDPAIAVAKAVKKDKDSFGILLCGSAHGVCMQANRFRGIRAINAFSPESAKLGREHDNANILCLSADLFDLKTLEKIIYEFFHTKFETKERRMRRIKKLDEEKYD